MSNAITYPAHIENRRLFDAAAGAGLLEEWERQHLHECQVCQGVLYVFISQQTTNSSPAPEDPSAAA